MKIGLVCSHGGHLTEMLHIVGAFNECDVFLITYDSSRSRSLKIRSTTLSNLGRPGIGSIRDIIRLALTILRERPDVVVSNGAEIAIPAFIACKVLSVRTVFIESYTRVLEPTTTGRIVFPISNVFVVTWPDLLKSYGAKAQFVGSPYIAGERQRKTQLSRKRVLVLTGMHFVGFDRLVRAIDELAAKMPYDFVVQKGPSVIEMRKASSFAYSSYEEIMEMIGSSSVVVCHGAMSAVDSLLLGVPVIIVPRDSEIGEVRDSHQGAFAKRLFDEDLITKIDRISELESAIEIVLDDEAGTNHSLKVNHEFADKIRKLILAQLE